MLTAGLVPDEDEFDLMPEPDSEAAITGTASARPAAAPVLSYDIGWMTAVYYGCRQKPRIVSGTFFD